MPTKEGIKEDLCPGCGGDLKEVYAEAHYGRYLILDQCLSCGGIWFDKWELYSLKDYEADRLDPVDSHRLFSSLSLKKGSGQCPVCRIDLEPFYDLNLPEDANIKRCPECSGLWLNRGELKRYEEHRKGLKSRGKDLPSSSNQPHLLTPEDHDKRLEELQALGKAISNKVTPEIPDAMTLDEPEIEGREIAKDLVWIIIQILLRLFLRI